MGLKLGKGLLNDVCFFPKGPRQARTMMECAPGGYMPDLALGSKLFTFFYVRKALVLAFVMQRSKW